MLSIEDQLGSNDWPFFDEFCYDTDQNDFYFILFVFEFEKFYDGLQE